MFCTWVSGRRIFKIPAKCQTQKGLYEKQVYGTGQTGLIYQVAGKGTYLRQITSKAPDFKSLKDHAINYL